jgi:hypothetical protein
MIQEEKRFYGGGMDSDSAIEYIDRADWLSAFNIRVTGTEQQEMGYATSFEGTEPISYTLPAGINKCIGAKSFKNFRKAYCFIYNSNLNHSILEFDFDTNALTKLFVNLTDSAGLNIITLDPKEYVEDMNFIGEELYFLPSDRVPYKINPTKLKSGFYGVVQLQDLKVIKPKPTKLVTFDYYDDAGRSANLIENQLIKFSNQFVFKDKQEGVYSELTKIKVPINGQSGAGSSGVNNALLINVNVSDDRVETIVIGAKFNNDAQWKEVKRIERSKAIAITATTIDVGLDIIEAYNPATNLYTFIFYNDGLYPAIDEQETDLDYDRVPKKANAQVELNGNILSYGGITEGFNPIAIDMTTEVTYIKKLETTTAVSPTRLRFRELKPVVLENLAATNLPFFARRPILAYFFEGIVATGDVIDIQTKHMSTGSITRYNYTVPANFNGDTLGALNNFGATQNFANGISVRDLGGGLYKFTFNADQKHRPLVNDIRLSNTATAEFKSVKALKLNSSRQYAIKYEYPDGRLGGVLTSDKLIAKTEPYGVTQGASPIVTLNINHTPPADAIGYYILSSGQLTHLNSIYMIGTLITPVLYSPSVTYTRGFFVSSDGDVYRSLEKSLTGVAPNTDPAKWSLVGSFDDYVNNTYLAFDVTSLKRFNDKNSSSILNYEYTEGDRANLCFRSGFSGEPVYYTGTPKDVAVSAFELDLVSNDQKNPSSGFILKIQKADIDSTVLSGSDLMIEVYTPNRVTTDTNLFYAIGERYNIVAGAHETTRIEISEGECFIKTRQYLRPTDLATARNYIVEDFNYSDFAETAVTDLGRGFIFNKEEKQEYLQAHLRYSDIFNRNTGINKLNRFKAENIYGDNSGQTTNIYGAIRKLRQRGSSLIVWQELETGYVPVNITIFEDANGQSNVAVSDRLLNNIRYNGNFIGIGNQTKAFTENDGDYYFVDPSKSEPFKADGGGIRSISGKMSKYFRDFIKAISDTNRNLIGVYNDFTDEWILSAELQSGVVIKAALDSSSWTGDEYGVTAGMITISTQPTNGTVVYNITTGIATYTPNTDFVGYDPFVFDFDLASRNVCLTVVAGDKIPNSFFFIDVTGQPVSTLISSNAILVDGINIPTAISVVGGEYEKNNSGVYTSLAGTVVNGDSVRVRQTSSASNTTTTDCTLTIGGISDTFSIETTAAAPSGSTVFIRNGSSGSDITSVIIDSVEFIASPPLTNGQSAVGTHLAFTGAIEVSLIGGFLDAALTLNVNSVLIDTKTIFASSASTETFASATYASTDVIEIDLS